MSRVNVLVFFTIFAFFYSPNIVANNAFYISISDQVARKQDLEIISNNAANSSTVGYEEDSSIYHNYDVMESRRKNNSFVHLRKTYKSGELGPIKQTGNPLDLVIQGTNQYFKVQTPRGPRYTLSGSMFRNINGLLVNSDGFHFLTGNNAPIGVPTDAAELSVLDSGIIMADGNQVDIIGVFKIADKNALIKEGRSLYKSSDNGTPLDVGEFKIKSGALRGSNVNSGQMMSQTIEAQRSFSTITNLISELNSLEKNSVSRILGK